MRQEAERKEDEYMNKVIQKAVEEGEKLDFYN